MATQLKTKPGINGANTLSIPKDWDPAWFRHFIHNSLKGADVRNAVGTGGIKVTGNISSPYATIDGSGIAAAPAAPSTSIQFNNGGVFGGSANLEWNGVSVVINTTTTNAALAITTPASNNGNLITAAQTGISGTWEVYLPSGSGNLNFFNNLAGDVVEMQNNGSVILNALNSAAFGSAYSNVAGLLINNASATMQSTIDFGKAGVLSGRIRSDFQGGLSLVGTSLTPGNGVILWVGGDSGAGTPRLVASGATTAPLVQIIGGGTGATSGFASGGRATLQLNGSGDSLIDFAVNGTSNAFIYSNPTASELRLNSLVGNITFYTANALQVALSQTSGLQINPPTTNVYALSATATSTTTFSGGAALFVAPNTTSQSNGVRIIAGTNTSDMQLILTNGANTINYWIFGGDGGVVSSGNTSKGQGTINAAGLFINGVAVSGASPTFVVATATETRTSTTTGTNSTQLTFAIPAAGTYAIQGQAAFTAGIGSGFACGLNYSGTFTAVGSFIAYLSMSNGTTAGSFTNEIAAAATTVPASQAGIISAPNAGIVVFNGTLIATGAGTISMSFAQQASSANPTTLNIGSYLSITKIH